MTANRNVVTGTGEILLDVEFEAIVSGDDVQLKTIAIIANNELHPISMELLSKCDRVGLEYKAREKARDNSDGTLNQIDTNVDVRADREANHV
jgi:hypothetical protein